MKDSNKKKIYIGISIALILVVGIVLLFVVFTKEKFTVTFKVDNEVYKELKDIAEGDTVNLSSTPKKEGYTFDGWYVNGKKFDFNTEIDSNIELEAKFTINTYTVTFDYDNDDDNKSIEVTYNEKAEKPTNPKKNGYTFAGWYVEDEEYDFDSPVTDDLKITAKWTKITTAKYTVLHYLMGLDGKYNEDKASEIQSFTGKIGATISPDVKTYEGFKSPEKQSVEVKADGTSVVKYYYERNKYTLTITGDEGIKEITGSGTYYYGSSIKVSATLNPGYDFANWSNKNANSTMTYTMGNKDATLKAESKLINYQISYVGIFGDNEESIDTTNPKTYTIKDEIVLEDIAIEGYTLKNFIFNDNILEDKTIKAGNIGNIVIKALFEANTYNVTFETELGEFNSPEERTLSVKYKELITDVTEVEEYIPTRDSYTFVGWSLNKETEEQELYDFNTPMVAHDVVLYPVWKPIDYNITYELEDGVCTDCDNLKTYNIESQFNLPTPTKEGYKFDGWLVDETEDVITAIEPGRTGEIKLIAKWLKIIDLENIDSILGQDSDLINEIKDGNLVVGIKDETAEIDAESMNILKNNFQSLFDNGYVTKIEVKVGETIYEITEANIDEVLNQIKEAFLNNSSSISLMSANDTYAELISKSLEVTIYLNDNAISSNGTNTISYTISFRKLEKITKETINALVDQNTKFINQNKAEHYEAVVRNKNDLVFTYDKTIAQKDVFGTMMGAGLKTAMQTFLGNENIGYIVITLEGMDPVKVTYDDIKENNFWGFGLKLLDSFEAAVGKGAFSMKNEDLIALKAKLVVYAADGKYFDESFTTNYNISFEERN